MQHKNKPLVAPCCRYWSISSFRMRPSLPVGTTSLKLIYHT